MNIDCLYQLMSRIRRQLCHIRVLPDLLNLQSGRAIEICGSMR